MKHFKHPSCFYISVKIGFMIKLSHRFGIPPFSLISQLLYAVCSDICQLVFTCFFLPNRARAKLAWLGKFWLSLRKSIFVVGRMQSVFQYHTCLFNCISWKTVQKNKWKEEEILGEICLLNLPLCSFGFAPDLQLAVCLVLPLGNGELQPIFI